jgi:hypothetical protein
MTLMMAKLYAALKAANAPEAEAREAAEEAAMVHDRFDKLDRGLELFRTQVAGEIETLRTELRGEIGNLRTQVTGEIGTLRTELKGEIETLRTELKGEIGILRTDVKGEIRRVEWLLGGLLAIAVAVAGRLFLHG